MTTFANLTPQRAERQDKRRNIHPLFVRITHWINAIAILIMIGSGLQIHNAYPILPFQFPAFMTIGGWLGGALLWHFAFMWLLVANVFVMVIYGIISGRYRAKLLPIHPRAVIADIRNALSGKLSHADLNVYNAIQKLMYLGVLIAIFVVILSGIAIWKPVQFQGLTALLGGFQSARLVHFIAMSLIAGFLIIHVVMALIVPRTIKAMLTGRS
jgi:thiosulfate reductase cytochrome b subunit